MSNELREGVEIKFMATPPVGNTGSAWQIGDHGNCKRIVVVEQNGFMASIPWARCELNDGRVHMVNLAHVETVELA